MNNQVNAEGVIQTLSLRIAQLETDKAVLIEQVKELSKGREESK